MACTDRESGDRFSDDLFGSLPEDVVTAMPAGSGLPVDR